MKSFVPVATLLFAASALAQLTINTPINPPVCQPLRLSWSGGTPPYFLIRHFRLFITQRVLPGNDPTGNTVLDFGEQTGTGLTWTVNVTAGTSLGLTLTDSTGTVAQSAAFTVQTSTDQSCLNAKTTGAGSSAAGASSAAGSSPATTAVSTPAVTTPISTPVNTPTTPATSVKASSAAAGSSSAAHSSASASSTAKSSAQKVTFGLAGALGAAALALLA